MAEINPLDEAVAVVVVTVDEVRLAAGAVVAEIKAAVVAGTDTFAARMSVRVRRRIGTDVEVAGIFVAGVIAAVVFRDGGGLNTRVGIVLRTGGGRNTKVGVEVTVAGREWRPGVLAGIFVETCCMILPSFGSRASRNWVKSYNFSSFLWFFVKNRTKFDEI